VLRRPRAPDPDRQFPRSIAKRTSFSFFGKPSRLRSQYFSFKIFIRPAIRRHAACRARIRAGIAPSPIHNSGRFPYDGVVPACRETRPADRAKRVASAPIFSTVM
jgi:hypothetical protein